MAAITVQAVFDGTTDTVAVSYSGIAASVPEVIAGDPIMTNPTDSFVDVVVSGDPTSSGLTLKATAPFVGKVNVLVIG